MNTIPDDIDFLQFIGKQESQHIAPASTWQGEVVSRFEGEQKIHGDLLPWSKTHQYVALRPGEVSLWGGYSGHGKSQLVGQVCAWGLPDKSWLLASLEMKPAATLERMIKQVAGNANPPEEYINRFLGWTDNRLWIYDQTDTVATERLIGMVHYAAQELKVAHVVIDCLIKCGIGREDYEKQAAFVDRLCWAAKSENIHVHLVHHMRKGQGSYDEYKLPSKHDFRGAGEITDLVDNVFIVHRNKGKEEKVRKGEIVSEEDPDCFLKVDKQRHGEWEGTFKLWFHKESMQYTPKPDNRVMLLPREQK